MGSVCMFHCIPTIWGSGGHPHKVAICCQTKRLKIKVNPIPLFLTIFPIFLSEDAIFFDGGGEETELGRGWALKLSAKTFSTPSDPLLLRVSC